MYWQFGNFTAMRHNFAVGSQMAIVKVLADFNLAVRYGIAVSIYASKKF